MEYGCGVRNRYELFADEDGGDPLELIQREEERRRLSQLERSKNKAAEGAKQATSVSKAPLTNHNRINAKENSNKSNQQTEAQRPRDHRTQQDSNRKPRDSNDGNRNYSGDDRRQRKISQDGNQDSKRVGGRDDKGLRPSRGPRKEPSDRDPKDTKDRPPRTDRDRNHQNSQTTTGAGAMAANNKTELGNQASQGNNFASNPKATGENQTSADGATPIDQDQIDRAATDTKEEETPAEGEVEPETPEKTLDQWKKELEARKSKTTYNAAIRKPNEGESSDPKWAKMKMIKKKKDSDSPAPIISHKEHHPVTEDMLDEEDRKLKRLEETVSKQFHYLDSRGNTGSTAGGRSNRGGRGGSFGGRGGGRGGRTGPGDRSAGGGDSRGSRGHAHNGHNAQQPQSRPTPRVEDLNDFPSLAA
ncbi:plasminogen activator inhibitor 1 RNA-binding protein-like [Varroa jacobsoni]|uniref:Uncharacterized protein n=1 Tax=Varroa destructor TaxID=109461 RepID=A0A7M7MI92_VARDE|nr:plasminogen activator inhibitor 1 RNA-binding protein-like [Varroa destructor]XP_022710945.1 plasminogen activator inhibitor 1 RNA-binding protein-like [Varroa jacobsoni]